MSEFSRRDLLQGIALSVSLGGLSPAAAQHVHSVAADEKATTGVYKPKALNPHEYQTLEKLADLPAREVLQAQFLGLLLSPATRLVRLLNEPGSALARLSLASGC